MGKILRRILIFTLGFIMGLTSIGGTLIGVSFYTYKKMSLTRAETIAEELSGEDFINLDKLGQFKDMTIEDSLSFAVDMLENPQNYSIKELEAKYGFDFETMLKDLGVNLKDETEKDKENISALKEMNLAFLLSGDLSAFLDTISGSSLYAILPKNLLSSGTRARLANYSLRELIEVDPITGNYGIIDALGQVKFGGLFPQFFIEKYNPNANVYSYEYESKDQEWLNLLGNLNFGSLLNGFLTKKSDILTELMTGRLTDLSDKPIREIFGDLGATFSDGMSDKMSQYFGLFGDGAITDWFVLSEDGNWEFSIDGFLKQMKIGYVMGYEYDEEFGWYTGSVGNKQSVDGLKEIIADLNIYGFYQSYKNGTLKDEILYQLGPVSFGSFLEEFVNYTYDEETNTWDASNSVVQDVNGEALDIFTAFAGLSVKGILNGTGDIGKNVITCLRNSVSGYKIGDFISDFANIEGLNPAVDGLASIKVADLILDKYTAKEVVYVLKEAVGELTIGEIANLNANDNPSLEFLFNFKIRNVLDIFLSDMKPHSVVKALLGDTTIGELLIAFAKFTYEEATGEFKNFKGESTVPALYTLKDVKVWEIFAGFDNTSSFDLIPVLKQIRLGDFVGYSTSAREINETWTINNFAIKDKKITGAANHLLSINLGDIFDPDITAEQILTPLKESSIGEVFQSVLGMYLDDQNIWQSTYANKIFDFMVVLSEIPTSINGVIDFATKKSGETLQEFLEGMLGGVSVGNIIGDLLGYSYDSEYKVWTLDNGNGDAFKVIETFLDYQVINDTFAIVNSDNVFEGIANVVKDLELGHFIEPFTKFRWTQLGWTLNDKFVILILQDLLGVRIDEVIFLVEDIVNGNGVKGAEIAKTIVGEERFIKDYVMDISLNYPIILDESINKINLYEFFAIVVDKNFDTKITGEYASVSEYLKYIFAGIAVGHIVQIIDKNLYVENGVWGKEGRTLKLIQTELYAVRIYNVAEAIINFVNKKGNISDISLQIFPKERTLGDYMLDILPNSNKALVESIYKINSYEAIRILVEKAFTEELPSGVYANEIEYLIYIFGTVEIGHFVQNLQNLAKDENGKWYKIDGSISSTLSAVYGIKPIIIVGLAYYLISGEPVAPLVENLEGVETIGDIFGDLGFKFAPLTDYTFNKNLYEFVDAIVDGNYAKYGYNSRGQYLKGMYEDLRYGHFVQDFLGIERIDGNWYKEGVALLRILNSTYNIRVVYTIEFIANSIKNKNFEYYTFYGDNYGETTDVGYYLAEVLKHDYNQDLDIYTDSNGYKVFNAIRIFYSRVPYVYLSDIHYKGIKVASENQIKGILIGDLIYDILSSKLSNLDIVATKQGDVYVNEGEWANLFDTIYNIELLEAIKNGRKKEFYEDNFYKLLVGDYIASGVKKVFKNLQYYSEIEYVKDTNEYSVKYEFNRICTFVFNKTIQEIIDGVKEQKNLNKDVKLTNPFLEYLTNEWLGQIYVGDFLNRGLQDYNEKENLWYNGDEVIPVDFDLMSTLHNRVLGVTIYRLTHKFNYRTLIEDLFLGNSMALTRYMELNCIIDNNPINTTIYVDADRAYTLDENGNEVKFPYEINLEEGEYYVSVDGWDYDLEVVESYWYETKLFEREFKVDVYKDENGIYQVKDEETGTLYECEYLETTNNYKVIINGNTEYFRIYRGTSYWATEDGDFKRFNKNFIVQKLSDIQLMDMLNGTVNIEKELGKYYLGEVMGKYKGDVVNPAGSLDYRKDATYKWYKDKELTQELTGVDYVINNIVLGTIFDGTVDFMAEIQELYVRDIFKDANKVSILKLFADTKIKNLVTKFDELYIGEVMEFSKKEMLYKDIEGNYIYPTSIPNNTSYTHYVRFAHKTEDGVLISYENIPVSIASDNLGDFYTYNSQRYSLTIIRDVWIDDNNIAKDYYSVLEDGTILDKDDNVIGSADSSDGYFYTTTQSGTESTPIEGLEYLVKIGDNWHKAYQDKEMQVEVCDGLMGIFADIQIKDISKDTFVEDLTKKVKESLSVGEFFTPSNDGMFNLFTQKELDNILIKDFSYACTTKIKSTPIVKFAEAKLIDNVFERKVNAEGEYELVKDENGNYIPRGLFKIFTAEELNATEQPDVITIANIVEKINDKVNNATLGFLIESELAIVSAENKTKLDNVVPGWRDMTMDQILNVVFNKLDELSSKIPDINT